MLVEVITKDSSKYIQENRTSKSLIILINKPSAKIQGASKYKNTNMMPKLVTAEIDSKSNKDKVIIDATGITQIPKALVSALADREDVEIYLLKKGGNR